MLCRYYVLLKDMRNDMKKHDKLNVLMENPSHQSDSSSSSSSEDEDIKSKVTRVLKKRLVVLLLQLLRDSSIDKE